MHTKENHFWRHCTNELSGNVQHLMCIRIIIHTWMTEVLKKPRRKMNNTSKQSVGEKGEGKERTNKTELSRSEGKPQLFNILYCLDWNYENLFYLIFFMLLLLYVYIFYIIFLTCVSEVTSSCRIFVRPDDSSFNKSASAQPVRLVKPAKMVNPISSSLRAKHQAKGDSQPVIKIAFPLADTCMYTAWHDDTTT